jgi:hypothetical protein
MLHTDLGAGCAAHEVPLTSPSRERGEVRELVSAVLFIAATLGVILFVALVIVPSVSAAGSCGGG